MTFASLSVCLSCLFCILATTGARLTVSDQVIRTTARATFRDRGSHLLYPQDASPIEVDQYRYFADKLDFETVQGKIMIGGVDNLYLLNSDLTLADSFSWNSSQTCDNTVNNANYVCRNHIRVYNEIPESISDTRSLLVCGTQSSVMAQCRTIQILNGTEGSVTFGAPGNTSNSVSGILSSHPDLHGFGEFRRSSSTDTKYFSASLVNTNEGGYDLSYLTLDIQNSTGLPVATRDYGWYKGQSTWLNFPVVFVDYKRASYPFPSNPLSDAYHFYLVFLREKSQGIISSQVIRICRNDPGVEVTPDNKIFSTFLKANIFCERQMPQGESFVGSLDFQYNEIWSVGFNKGGRYHSEADYVELMYGAFSGPLIGPPGTAICVYPAYPSDLLNRGIFDIFREDVNDISALSTDTNERQNNFVECAPSGRNNSEDAIDIKVVHNVRQLGANPLVILNGFHVNQMAVDRVCVVTRSDSSKCVNQDVLFLGTDTGLVYKVVISTRTSGASGIIEPVIVDEIQLDDLNPVNEMKIETIESVKYLFVSTYSRIYRLPLETCSRFGSNSTACIASRDPHCVWNSQNMGGVCEQNPLVAQSGSDGMVPQPIHQNIHTGVIADIETTAQPSQSSQTPQGSAVFANSAIVVNESNQSVTVTVMVTNPTSLYSIQLTFTAGSAAVDIDYTLSANPIEVVVMNSTQTELSFSIPITLDNSFTENKQFSITLATVSAEGALPVNADQAAVTIIDEQGLLFQLTITGTGLSNCASWIKFDSAVKISLIEGAILEGLSPGRKLEDFPNLFMGSHFTCSDKVSSNDQNFVVFRSALDLTSFDGSSRRNVLTALTGWINTKSVIKSDLYSLEVVLETSCSTEILQLNSALCEFVGNGVPIGGLGTAGPIDSSGLVGGLGAVFTISIVVNIGLAVLLVGILITIYLLKKKKCNVNKTDNVGKVGVENNNHNMAAMDGQQPVTKLENVTDVDLESSGEDPKSTRQLVKSFVYPECDDNA